jgi:predicted nucleic acid-binding protein
MDSGPLVAWFSKRDSHHKWATQVFDGLPVGALVCEAVLAEVCHLVAKDGVPAAAVLKLVEQEFESKPFGRLAKIVQDTM